DFRRWPQRTPSPVLPPYRSPPRPGVLGHRRDGLRVPPPVLRPRAVGGVPRHPRRLVAPEGHCGVLRRPCSPRSSPSRPPPRLTAMPPTCSAPWDCKPSPPPLGLPYAFLKLGTPNVTFLVALDTGSDLFWVPCDCHQCAVAKFDCSLYSSLTMTRLVCLPMARVFGVFVYLDAYVSCYELKLQQNFEFDIYSTIEDVPYLMTEDETPRIVEAPIVFGYVAFNYYNHLRLECSADVEIKQAGAAQSFSMCFGDDGLGRINIGDKGSSDQQEAAFIINKAHSNPSFKINITGIAVGNKSTHMVFDAPVDSGTSFTALEDPIYKYIAKSFNAQAQVKRYKTDPDSTFKYCYELSLNQTSILLPEINLTTHGGSVFPVSDPIIIFHGDTNQSIYCLAIVKISGISILRQNFLIHVVFDRERLILGWKNSECKCAPTSHFVKHDL
ncbi:unnamed protein product, partial [Musa banksii]